MNPRLENARGTVEMMQKEFEKHAKRMDWILTNSLLLNELHDNDLALAFNNRYSDGRSMIHAGWYPVPRIWSARNKFREGNQTETYCDYQAYFDGRTDFSCGFMYEALSNFHDRGCPLSGKILRWLGESSEKQRREFFTGSDIPEKLYFREMGEEEYFAYINGDRSLLPE